MKTEIDATIPRTSMSTKLTMSTKQSMAIAISNTISSKMSSSTGPIENKMRHVIVNSDEMVLDPKFGGYISSMNNNSSNHSNDTGVRLSSEQNLSYNDEHKSDIEISTAPTIITAGCGDSEDLYKNNMRTRRTKGNDLDSDILHSESSDNEAMYQQFEINNDKDGNNEMTKQSAIEMFERDLHQQ